MIVSIPWAIRNSGFSEIRTSGVLKYRFPEFIISGKSKLRNYGFPDSRKSRNPGFAELRIAGNPVIRISGLSDSRNLGFTDFRKSKCHEIRDAESSGSDKQKFWKLRFAPEQSTDFWSVQTSRLKTTWLEKWLLTSTVHKDFKMIPKWIQFSLKVCPKRCPKWRPMQFLEKRDASVTLRLPWCLQNFSCRYPAKAQIALSPQSQQDVRFKIIFVLKPTIGKNDASKTCHGSSLISHRLFLGTSEPFWYLTKSRVFVPSCWVAHFGGAI